MLIAATVFLVQHDTEVLSLPSSSSYLTDD